MASADVERPANDGRGYENECYRRKALKCSLVLQTWSGTLQDGDDLPEDWTQERWLLVGMESPGL